MIPEEKAKELVFKYIEFTDNPISLYNAKHCALIAIDEILEVTKVVVDRPDFNGIVFNAYWLTVKLKIQSLEVCRV